jgi:hypothetical protein
MFLDIFLAAPFVAGDDNIKIKVFERLLKNLGENYRDKFTGIDK